MIEKIRFVILFIFFLPFALIAQNDTVPTIITDRPTQAESPYLMPRGLFQIETGMIFTDRTDEVNHIQFVSMGNTMLRYGLLEHLEVRVMGSYEKTTLEVLDTEIDSSYQGVGAISAGFKVFVARERGFWPEIAIVGSVTFRHLGDENYRPTYSYPVGKLALNHNLTKRLNLGYNIGFSYNGETPDGYFIYASFLGYKISNVVWSYLEVYGLFDNADLPKNRLDAGFTFLARNNLQFDIAAGVGLRKDIKRYFVSAGLSWRIPN
jgi:hypothetical protein